MVTFSPFLPFCRLCNIPSTNIKVLLHAILASWRSQVHTPHPSLLRWRLLAGAAHTPRPALSIFNVFNALDKLSRIKK